MSKSGKSRSDGGKKQAAKRDRKTEQPEGKKPKVKAEVQSIDFLNCMCCGQRLDPLYVWEIEVLAEDPFATVVHHCWCDRGSPNTWNVGRYPIGRYQLGLGYLMGFSREHVVFGVDGGWVYTNPVKMYVVTSHSLPMTEFVDDLKRIETVEDFLRYCEA